MTLILGPRDHAVYAWERETLRPHDDSKLGEAVTHAIVQHVWSDMGLIFPPVVEFKRIPDAGWGSRTKLTFPGPTSHVVLFHELAHAMDTPLEEEFGAAPIDESSHNDNWLGLFVNLLDRYVGGSKFNKITLLTTLNQRGITFSMCPKPRCI